MDEQKMAETRLSKERCILTCEHAHYANGMWACPMFINVDRVSVRNDNGTECRQFKRRDYA